MKNDPISGMVVLGLIVVGFAMYLGVRATWELLKLGGQLLQWIYETVKPPLEDAWNSWQRQRLEVRKPDYVRQASIAARQEIDQILAQHRFQVNQILQTEDANQPSFPEFILLSKEDYTITTEENNVRQ